MNRLLRRASLIVLLAIGLVACKEQEGSFRVVFEWADAEPDEDLELFAVARVEEDFDSGEGRVLASAGPELLQPGMSLDFSDVPIGAQRRVVVELRESSGSAALILYYGISEPFDMQAGQDTVVKVRLQLAPTPGALDGAGIAIADTPSPGVAASTKVKLRVVSDSAASVELSNRAGLPMGSSQRFELDDDKLADEQPEDEALAAHEIEWDLDEDLSEPCGEVDFCDRRVFARFEDAEGYLSRTFSAEITVDSKPPGVVEDSVALTLDPAADNVLVEEKRPDLIRAVANGTKITVVFALDERVIETPVVRAIGDGGDSEPLDFEYADRSSYVFQHEYAGRDPLDAVDFEVEVTAIDKAGTEATFSLGSFVVDTVPPDAPAEPDDEPTLVYERRPWGSQATGELSFAVRASPGSVAPESSVFFYDGPDIERAQRLGFLDRADDDGGFAPTSLARADAPQVYARVVDSAGNGAESATLVRDVEWTASLAGHVVGQSGTNPNSFESRPWSLGALRQADSLQSDGDPIATGDAPVRVSGAGRWQRTIPITTPTPRYWPGMAFDAARGRVVLFGGSNSALGSSETCDDTGLAICGGPMEWDGGAWSAPVIEGDEPAPSDSARAVWDSARGRTMLFGGKGAFGGCGRDSSFCAKLWAYDGERFELLDRGGDGSEAPQGRSNHIMAYDSRRDRVVLYGGIADQESEYCSMTTVGILCRDTWEWDGERWELALGDGPPGFRRFAAATYDDANGQVLMFGGETPDSPPLPETWAWDGETWKQVDAPAAAPQQPSGRLDASLTYSRKLGRVVMFGGQANDIGSCDGGPMLDYYCNVLWSFNGSHWERMDEPAPQLPSPVGRSRAGLAEDAFGNLVLFGGDRVSLGPAGDCDPFICPGMWLWEGEHWRLRTAASPAGAVSSRFNHAAAYDPATGSSYMFGGRQIETAAMCPGDPALQPLSINFLYKEDLWRWDGNAWSEVTTTGVAPGRREGVAMASLESAAPIALGGALWHYDGLTNRPAAGEERVCGDRVAVEERDLYQELSWTIDGDTLMDSSAVLASDGTPEVRGEAAVAGVADDALVMFGGARMCGELGDTWRYDAVDGWQAISAEGGPAARRNAALAYDRARDELVLFGGGTLFPDEPGANGELAIEAGCNRCRCAEEGTFVLEGDAWSSAEPSDEPVARWNAAMAYVDARESVLLAGGVAPSDCGDGTAKCGDTWEWDGAAWHKLEPADPEGDGNPTPREEHALVEDRARDELVMIGGTSNPREHTWLWRSGADARPAQLAHFAFGSTQAPEGVEIRDLSLDWRASAQSSAGDDLTMRVWNRGQLTPVEDLGFERDGDHWLLADPEALSALPYGPTREIAFAIEPAAPNGTHPGYARLETSFVELQVSYRLPAD
jgi:hypothetical protein